MNSFLQIGIKIAFDETDVEYDKLPNWRTRPGFFL